MKSFLVPIGGSATDEPLFAMALAAAQPFEAHLQFVHVRIGTGEAAIHSQHTAFARGPALRNALNELDAMAKTRSQAAAEHFRNFCLRSKIEICDIPGQSQGVTASWHQEDGNALERISLRARHNDLVIIGRAKRANGLPANFIGDLLVSCGRPILIANAEPPQSLTGTIMVCWKESSEAARAISAAMPFLAHAKRVIIVSVVENDQNLGGTMTDVTRLLAWHGVNAETRIITAKGNAIPELLASSAHDCEADMVVLGAYGHSRMRELLFGGCTQSVIDSSEKPVLLMY
jgi:nucleotide-binding universal stress UspA family protein